eukprot:s1047_g22.t1
MTPSEPQQFVFRPTATLTRRIQGVQTRWVVSRGHRVSGGGHGSVLWKQRSGSAQSKKLRAPHVCVQLPCGFRLRHRVRENSGLCRLPGSRYNVLWCNCQVWMRHMVNILRLQQPPAHLDRPRKVLLFLLLVLVMVLFGCAVAVGLTALMDGESRPEMDGPFPGSVRQRWRSLQKERFGVAYSATDALGGFRVVWREHRQVRNATKGKIRFGVQRQGPVGRVSEGLKGASGSFGTLQKASFGLAYSAKGPVWWGSGALKGELEPRVMKPTRKALCNLSRPRRSRAVYARLHGRGGTALDPPITLELKLLLRVGDSGCCGLYNTTKPQNCSCLLWQFPLKRASELKWEQEAAEAAAKASEEAQWRARLSTVKDDDETDTSEAEPTPQATNTAEPFAATQAPPAADTSGSTQSPQPDLQPPQPEAASSSPSPETTTQYSRQGPPGGSGASTCDFYRLLHVRTCKTDEFVIGRGFHIVEGSLEVKLPTIWTDGKAEMGRGKEERRSDRRKSEEIRLQAREKVGKSRNTVFFEWSKSRLAKAAGAEPSGEMQDEKVHAVMARSTFRSQKAQNTSGSERFWQFAEMILRDREPGTRSHLFWLFLMAELATFPAMECSYELLEALRRQLPDYEICKRSDTKISMLAGVRTDCTMYYCKWCGGVFFEFYLSFQSDSTILEDHIDTKYDCKVHELECNEQRERVKAKVKTAIALHSAIANPSYPHPMPIGKDSGPAMRTYEISFTKDGALGLSLNEEPGRMKVLKVKPKDCGAGDFEERGENGQEITGKMEI